MPKLLDLIKIFFFLKPCQKISIRASEFNVAQCAVAKHVASDAHVCLVLFCNVGGRHLEKLLKCFFADWNRCQIKYDLIVVA